LEKLLAANTLPWRPSQRRSGERLTLTAKAWFSISSTAHSRLGQNGLEDGPKGNGEKPAPVVVGLWAHRRLSKCFEGALQAGHSVHLENGAAEMDHAELPSGSEGVSVHNCPLALGYTNRM